MDVVDYDKISESIVKQSSVAVFITDHNPGNFEKTSHQKYAALVNEISETMKSLLPMCAEAKIAFGGHSASGQASLEAWQNGMLQSIPLAGYIGFDPYEIDKRTIDVKKILTIPSLFWGFTRTTCLVAKEKAAEGGYMAASPQARVLYKIHNEGSKITHCAFADR